MRKHEMSYHNHSNDISFLSSHCNHLRALERFFSELLTQIKEILQESQKKKIEFKLTKILKRNEKIESALLTKKKKKRKRKTKRTIVIESTHSNIYMIETVSFNLLIRQKEA
jgi:hypothetical protein